MPSVLPEEIDMTAVQCALPARAESSYLALAHRLDVTADDLETCRDQTLSLALERYWDDYSL